MKIFVDFPKRPLLILQFVLETMLMSRIFLFEIFYLNKKKLNYGRVL